VIAIGRKKKKKRKSKKNIPAYYPIPPPSKQSNQPISLSNFNRLTTKTLKNDKSLQKWLKINVNVFLWLIPVILLFPILGYLANLFQEITDSILQCVNNLLETLVSLTILGGIVLAIVLIGFLICSFISRD